MLPIIVFVFFVVIVSATGQNQTSNNSRIDRDSYIDAYTESHGGFIDANVINTDREASFPSGFGDGYPGEIHQPYPSPIIHHHHYGPPHSSHEPQKPSYGPPKHDYGPPHPAYGPPQPHYGPPHYPPPNYGPPPPPPPPLLPYVFGIPYGFLGILDKIKLKLNIITIFKILLKLVLFKKLVSFMAIIFLLLFIPWLKGKKETHGSNDDNEDDELMMRKFGTSHLGSNQINTITTSVLNAIDKYAERQS